MEQKQKIKLIVSCAFAGCFMIALFVGAFKTVSILRDYREGEAEYASIAKEATGTEAEPEEEAQVVPEAEPKAQEDTFTVDFDVLMEKNSDTVAWIRFYPEPAGINYPVVQTDNNDLYLNKTFSRSDNTLGAIFVDCGNSPGFSDENTVIYGHRMKNKTMFYHLQDYKDEAFWKENPFFYIYTPDGKVRTYKIFACCTLSSYSDTYKLRLNESEMQSFLDEINKKKYYDTGVDVKYGDKMITLSTCTSASDENRLTVRGVLVNIEETAPPQAEEPNEIPDDSSEESLEEVIID